MFDRRINRLAAESSINPLVGGRKGVEKESLRVTATGHLSGKPHPPAFGSALTNRYITTDFSEALLEFVTPAFSNTWETLRFLCDIHQFSYAGLGDELLWVSSMPCRIGADDDIPLARYGSSNVGRMKTIYRNGLGLRYGRSMQTIAGVHFNYSLPDAFWPVFKDIEAFSGSMEFLRSEAYFGLVRNFRRFGWLILYLFGASPALCRSFAGENGPKMPLLNGDTLYQPFATSLRMSDLGYSNRTQAKINISLNHIDEYIDDLTRAIHTPEPAFEKFGVKAGGEYVQLSVNQLQIENEYYSPIRPKRVANSGERPTAALRRGGVEYVEIRSLDINPFDPAGINQNAMRFVEAFVIYCLLQESPPLDDQASEEAARNHTQTAKNGRDPDFRLMRGGEPVSLRDWGSEIVRAVHNVAELIDRGNGGSDYRDAVDVQSGLLEDPDSTPSARLLEELNLAGTGFFDFALQAAKGHKEYFAAVEPMQQDRLKHMEQEASESLQRQRAIEKGDSLSLDEYLAAYFSRD
ncbi:MAG: glutamate--cysteine ligase [Gammaproteobacteria bacterium]|nr:glutamate--cysteine ligase [Gammaproteobacteria bacterium]MDH4313447.1 glutamate--cysteine ligase [Gammaproteobacteria bacterium]MDH5213023.1 glutamate--cysteine ligase [Gammaproteobacteria bacterium]